MSYSKSKARDPLRTRCFSCWGCGTSPEETPSRSSGAEGEQESEGQGAAEVNTVKQLQKKKKKSEEQGLKRCKMLWGIRGLGDGCDWALGPIGE